MQEEKLDQKPSKGSQDFEMKPVSEAPNKQ